VAKQRDGGRVTAERSHVVGDPPQRGDDVEQRVVTGRVAIAGRQEPYSNEQNQHTHVIRSIPAAVAVQESSAMNNAAVSALRSIAFLIHSLALRFACFPAMSRWRRLGTS